MPKDGRIRAAGAKAVEVEHLGLDKGEPEGATPEEGETSLNFLFRLGAREGRTLVRAFAKS